MTLEPRRDDPEREDEVEEQVERLLPVVLARLEQHLHLPMQMPDSIEVQRLKSADPATYRMWRREVRRRLKHDRWMEKAPRRLPFMIATVGQVFGLLAVFSVLALAGFLAYLDHPGWAAGLAIVDLAVLAGVFVTGHREEPP